MHSSFHLSCNSFPFFVCQLAEGFFNEARDCCEEFGFYLVFLYA
jgi:hypothetical protein